MESPLGALRYYLQRWQGSHLGNEVPHLFSAPSPFFVVESVTIHLIDCHLPSPWPCDSSEEAAFACNEVHDNKPLSPFLIYSNGPYGISTVTSISGTVLIFNIAVGKLHVDIFQMIAGFHFLVALNL